MISTNRTIFCGYPHRSGVDYEPESSIQIISFHFARPSEFSKESGIQLFPWWEFVGTSFTLRSSPVMKNTEAPGGGQASSISIEAYSLAIHFEILELTRLACWTQRYRLLEFVNLNWAETLFAHSTLFSVQWSSEKDYHCSSIEKYCSLIKSAGLLVLIKGNVLTDQTNQETAVRSEK